MLVQRKILGKYHMKYEGETRRKIGVRGSEHVKDLKKKSEANPLHKHQTMYHPQGGVHLN